MTEPLLGFTFNHADQPDRLSDTMTPAEVKAAFDSRGEELRVKVNEIIYNSNLDLKQFVDVRNYGAKGDGINDDSQAIQSAINDNDIIFIPAKHKVSSEITIPSNRIIFGNGLNSEIIADEGFMTRDGGNSILVLNSDATNVTIKGLIINGNLSQADLDVYPNIAVTTNPLSRAANLVCMQSNSFVSLINCKFINSITTSIKEYGTLATDTQGDSLTVDQCYFDNVLGNCIDGEFYNIRVTDNRVNLIGDIRGDSNAGTKGGLVVASAKYGVVSGNLVTQSTDSTIYINSSSGGVITISDNVIKYSGKDAIKAMNSANHCVIDGNIVVAAGKSCIGAYDDGTTDYGNCVISNNVIGFLIAPTDILDPLNNYVPKAITGCTNQSSIWSPGYASVALSLSSAHCTAIGNMISSVLGGAIQATEQSCKIQGNTIYNATGFGIRQQAIDFSITANVLENIGTNAAYSDGTGVQSIVLNTAATIGVVSLNVIENSYSDAIYAFTDTKDVVISNNTIDKFDGHGIYVNGAGSIGTVKDINITGNVIINDISTQRGVYARQIYNTRISSNVIQNCAEGIRADGFDDIIIEGNKVQSCTAQGIWASGTGNSAVITNNSVKTAATGVQVSSTVSNVVLMGNANVSCTTSINNAATTTKPSTYTDFNL